MNDLSISQNPNYETATFKEGALSMDVIVHEKTIWMSQKQIADLLGVDVQNVSNGIRYGVDNGMIEKAGIMKFIIPTAGGNQSVSHYSWDAVIYIAYRANPRDEDGRNKIIAFKQWVSDTLNRYAIKQLRSAEQAQYSDVRNFIAQASDYDLNNPDCKDYFASIQNKLLYAATGMTAAEIIVKRANANHANMGLHAWQGATLTKADAKVAKNYLDEDEMKDLAALVVVLAGGAHLLMVKQSSTMKQWVKYVDDQIILCRCKVLMSKGQYSHDQAMKIVEREYGLFKALLLK